MFGTDAVTTTDSWSKSHMLSLPDANFEARNVFISPLISFIISLFML